MLWFDTVYRGMVHTLNIFFNSENKKYNHENWNLKLKFKTLNISITGAPGTYKLFLVNIFIYNSAVIQLLETTHPIKGLGAFWQIPI